MDAKTTLEMYTRGSEAADDPTPLFHGVPLIDIIAEVRRAEREACAQVALMPIFTANETDAAVAKAIAMTIRDRQ